MADDPLSSALEEKRAIINAAYKASGWGRDRTANEIYARAIALSALAALRAAIGFHVEAAIEDMPDPFHYCKTCSGHPKWPCPEVAAISRELNGR